jgi:pimeloyl-ACP methyl ester carboxylesterase
VFLHGAGFTRRWLPMYDMLAQRCDFIAPESPGFGETPMPAWFRDFSDLSILYDQLFEQLGLDRIHLVGYSMGGWAASEFAAYYPRRLKSLTLIVPVGLRLPDNPGVDMFQLPPADLLDRLFNDKQVMAEFIEGMGDFDEGIHLYSEFSAAARLMWAPRYNLALERRLQRLTCPTLVVRAEDDRLVPNEMAEKYAAILPNNRLVMIPGTGHEPCLERPAELVHEIATFIAEAAQ